MPRAAQDDEHRGASWRGWNNLLIIPEHYILERTDDPLWYYIVAGAGQDSIVAVAEHVQVATVAEQASFAAMAELALVAGVAE